MDDSFLDKDGRYWRIDKWFPDLTLEVRSALRAYHSEILFFNGRMNLISPRSEKNADQVHISDAILGAKHILSRTTQRNIFDIGSGNGVPGIVMSILAPDRKFFLVDADARKAEFLKHVSARLELSNCSVITSRLEDLPEGSVHCAVTRGFASISKCLIMSRKAAAVKAEYFHFKGPAWSKEIADVPPQVLAYWEPAHLFDYTLPDSINEYSIVKTTRISL